MNNIIKVEDFQIIEGRDIYACMKMIQQENPVPVYTKQYAPGHVFDENQTVKWNREEVIRQNQAAQDSVTRARNVRNESENNLHKAVVRYIIGQGSCGVHIDSDMAENIINFAKNVHEDTWWEWLDDVIDYTVRVINQYKNQ